MNKVAIILPHQDDEIGIFNFLSKKKNSSTNIYFFYLTSGTFIKSKITKIRNLESIKVLNKFNISKKNIYFIGDDLNIYDQMLFDNYKKIIPILQSKLQKLKIDTLICPIWEGGHPDHDAAFLISKYMIKKLNIKNFFQFPLYNKKKYIFFNILKFNSFKNFNYKKKKYSVRLGLEYLLNIFKYKSQRKTFLILFQSLLLHFLFRRYEIRTMYDNLPLKKPQEGMLWYEKRYKITYSKFRSKSLFLY